MKSGNAYTELGPDQKRGHNFQKVAALLANRGFKCTMSSDKKNRTGFLAHHIERDETLRCQLKTRFVIEKKIPQRRPVHRVSSSWQLVLR